MKFMNIGTAELAVSRISVVSALHNRYASGV
jgi:hypothetical protein